MPIIIKEISIKADLYPAAKSRPEEAEGRLTARELERVKAEITREVTQIILQKLRQSNER